eukprot:2428191-Rhodomonas_salina.1
MHLRGHPTRCAYVGCGLVAPYAKSVPHTARQHTLYQYWTRYTGTAHDIAACARSVPHIAQRSRSMIWGCHLLFDIAPVHLHTLTHY